MWEGGRDGGREGGREGRREGGRREGGREGGKEGREGRRVSCIHVSMVTRPLPLPLEAVHKLLRPLTCSGGLLLDDGYLHVLDLDPHQQKVDLAHYDVSQVVPGGGREGGKGGGREEGRKGGWKRGKERKYYTCSKLNS